MKERVVITGAGVISPLGLNLDTFWHQIKAGVCGIGLIKSFDTTGHKVKLAAEVRDFDPQQYMDRKKARHMDRFCQFALAAAQAAYADAQLSHHIVNPERLGVIIGSGIGGLDTIQKQAEKLVKNGPGRISPYFIPMSIINMAAGTISIALQAKGESSAIVTACASGTYAIGEAFRRLQYGEADAVITGGVEASITPLGLAGFASLTALYEGDDSQRASIPFDAERKGFVMGEGGAMLVLESLTHAQARGARIYAEVVGYGRTTDAYHITSPAPGGEGAARAISLALADAEIFPADIDYVNAHGTSTPYNDVYETAAIKKVFGEQAYCTPISSTKSMTGHLLGAAGALEAIVCMKAVQEGFIPATINYEKPDPECDLDYVPNVGRVQPVQYALSNSLGFGGHNGSLIIKRWGEN